MRIGVLTGGGDVPGMNAAIRAVVRRALEYDHKVFAIKDGYRGLIEGEIELLTKEAVSEIFYVGGTILGSSRTNPLKREGGLKKCLGNIEEFGLGALVAIGGDDTLGVAYELYKRGVPVVGIPKTMDNDVCGTDQCIGFDTAVARVVEALDELRTTARSHHRVFVLEVMGRHAGWVATVGGIGGGADLTLIPEVPSSLDAVCKHVERRWEEGERFSLILASEAAQIEGMPTRKMEKVDEFGHTYLVKRQLGPTLTKQIEKRTGKASRCVVLGHIQRGGSPTVFDRVLATRAGVKAVDMIEEGKFGYMAALKGNQIVPVELEKAAGCTRQVDLELYRLTQTFY
ncbi:MAG: ATP-dependent 6-phosphofructokinase [Chloroflexota bacterium]|nr:ATP-dependent 6-phosphofructokinase [Chloroflexota bacterium]